MRWRVQLLAASGAAITLSLDFILAFVLLGTAILDKTDPSQYSAWIVLCVGLLLIVVTWWYLLEHVLESESNLGSSARGLRYAFFVVISHIVVSFLTGSLLMMTHEGFLGAVMFFPLFIFGLIRYGLMPLIVVFAASYCVGRILLKLNRSYS